jgi:outer membrane protein, heavy metal efflux system
LQRRNGFRCSCVPYPLIRFVMRVHYISILAAVAIQAGAAARETGPDGASSNSIPVTAEFVSQLAEELRTNHPAIHAASARIDAADAHVKSIRKWEDPMVRFGFMSAEREMRMEEGDRVSSFEQKLPLFGKPEAERRMAEAGAEVQKANSAKTFQELRRNLSIAVFKTALADRIVEIAASDLQWLETLQELAQHRYAVGDATQLDVLRLQNEKALRATQLRSEKQLLIHERTALNRLLNRKGDSPWPVLGLPEVAGPLVYSQKLVDLAVRYQPELNAKRMEIKEAEASVEVTRRQQYPDLSVGAEVRNYSDDGSVRQGMLTLSFNIPWGNGRHYRAAIQREKSKASAAQFEASDYELRLRNEVHELTVKIDNARRDALLYRDEIIPRNQVALETAQAAWTSGRGMFRDVLEARRMLLESQLMQARAVTEQYQMMSDLVLCCGLGDLQALEMIGVIPEPAKPETQQP